MASGNIICCLVKFLNYFEECSSCLVNFLAFLFALFSVVVKANLYLGSLISKAAAPEMNLGMKLWLRAWYENSLQSVCSKFCAV